MYSIQCIENVVKTLVRSEQQHKFNIELYAWNRTKEDKSDPEMITTHQQVDSYGNLVTGQQTSRTNQRIGCFSADINNWNDQCYRAKRECQKQELGIGCCVYESQHRGRGRFDDSMYLAMIDFNPGLTRDNRYTMAFWKDIENKYQGRKLYLFDSGNAHHAIMDTLLDDQAYSKWMETLANHEEVVDQKWVEFAGNHSHGGVIRTTSGTYRPQPKLWKWVNL